MLRPVIRVACMSNQILHINSSARGDESATLTLGLKVVEKISSSDDTVTKRFIEANLPLLDSVTASQLGSTAEGRTGTAVETLAVADALIDELLAADVIVIGAPIYNFGVPAGLKAWADLVAQAGRTFQYTETGPEGLLKDKQVIIVVAAGGVPIESDYDHGTSWLRAFLGFLGLTNVKVVAANGLATDPAAGIAAAEAQIAELTLS